MIEIKDLELFLDVANTGSLTEAARTRAITQPAATFRLRKIEQKIGVEMFVRKSRGLDINESGQTFKRYAEIVLQSYNSMLDMMALYKEKKGDENADDNKSA